VLIALSLSMAVRPEEIRASVRESKQDLTQTKVGTPPQYAHPTAGILAPGETYAQLLTLATGKYVGISVVPEELDVSVSVFAPNGHPILYRISPYGPQGPVDAFFVAKLAGVYKITVSATDNNAHRGSYQLRLDPVRKATARDELRAEAEGVISEAQQLRHMATAESRRGAIRLYGQALTLLRSTGDRPAEAQTLESLGSVHNDIGNNQKAVELFRRALLLFMPLRDRRGEAMARSDLGSVENDLGNNKQALIDLNMAISVRNEIGDQRGEAETLDYIGTLYENTSEFEKSLQSYNAALVICRKIGDLRGEAESLKNIGVVYYDIDEEKTALEYYSKALFLQQVLHDRWGEALTLNSIGAVYDSLGDKKKALEYFAQSLPLKAAVGNRQGEAHTLGNMCATERTLGEWQNAIDHCRVALDVSREIGDRQEEAAALMKLGLVYMSLGEPQRALKQFQVSLLLTRATNWPLGEATNLNNIGQVFQELKNYDKALMNYELALPIRRKVRDRTGEAATLSNIGRSYEAQGKAAALEYFKEALTVSRVAGSQQWEASSLNNIAWLYAGTQQYEKAIETFNQSLSVYQKVGDQAGMASVLYGIAHVERDLGELLPALAHIESALNIIEVLRTKVTNDQLRTSYFSSVRNYYEFHVDLLMQLEKEGPSKGYAARAFEESERSRARTLLETIQEARVDFHRGVDTALLERERSLQQLLEGKVQRQMRLLADQHKERQVATVKTEIDELQTEFQAVESQIRATSPAYAALTQPHPLKLNEIQKQLLDTDTVLLEYLLGDQDSYLWAVTSDSIQSFRLPKRSEVEPAATRVYDLLISRNRHEKGEDYRSRRDRLKQADSEFLAATLSLSHMVIGPVATLIRGKRLLIVADGALQFVPFGVLPVEDSEQSASPNPLVTEHEIVELPSASVLGVSRLARTERKSAAKSVAILADPVFDEGDSRVKRVRQTSTQRKDTVALERPETGIQTRSGSKHLHRLLFARQEARSILGLVAEGDGFEALDFRASRALATSPELSQYRIIHFATHGLLDSEHPELSGLVLSLVDEQGRAVSGFLDLQDIYNLNLPAELVVLSACETALGKEVKGEGLIGLTRGFMYAGADRVVASLWKVDDAATAELMERFYRGILQGGLRPAAALREAQIQMLKQERWANPYYWGAFTIQGEWR
jgi:CHAT domain-containing protein